MAGAFVSTQYVLAWVGFLRTRPQTADGGAVMVEPLPAADQAFHVGVIRGQHQSLRVGESRYSARS
jgi:hypothetical protein